MGHLNREGIQIAKCTVEQLVRCNGWAGVTRQARPRTTIADPAASRASDPAAAAVHHRRSDPFERMQAQARGDVELDPHLEQLTRLRDSNRPEDRVKAEALLNPRMRMTLGRYENARRQHVEAGSNPDQAG